MAGRRSPADPFASIRSDIESDDLKPIYLLFGQEAHLARQAYDLLFAAAVAGGPRGFNDQVFEGRSASGDAIAGAAQHMPMMAKRRVIVVRNAGDLKKDDQDRLAVYCARPSPTTVVILLGSDASKKVFDGRGKLAKALKKVGRWCDFKKLYGRTLKTWIDNEARALGKRLDADGADVFEALMGNDLAQIANGLRHAALFVGEEERITREDLGEVLVGRRAEALWDLLDAVGRRDLQPALANLQQLWRQGEGAYGVMSLVSRRVRQLLLVERGIAHGLPQKDALLAAGVAPNMAWKWRDQLGRYRPAELQRASSRMLKAESDLKGGFRIDPRWAIEAAVQDVIGRR
jgi:DNA polymerase-3 subunit delta